MRPYILLFFTFSILAFKSNGQKISMPQEVRTYYEHINRAELNIIDTNYSEAQKEYQLAFKLKYPNGKDLYNAFVVSYYITDTAWATKYFNLLSYHGLEQGFFSDSAYNLPFYKTVTAMHDSAYQAGYAAVDHGAIEFWDIVLEFSQKYRKPNLHLTKGESRVNEYKELDKLNAENIAGYLSNGGKFTFKDIGFWTKKSSPAHVNYPFYYHFFCTKNNNESLNEYLQLCLNGEVDIVNMYALFSALAYGLTDMVILDSMNKRTAWPKRDNSFYEKYGLAGRSYTKSQIKIIDSNCKLIGFSNYQDYKRRRMYDSDHKINSGVWERNMFIFFTGR